MIRQSQEGEEPGKQPHRDTDEQKRQAQETGEIPTGIFDEGDDLDPADFFDPEDFGTRAQT